jgi:tryptophanyl-tRNA synthetase
MGYAVSKQMLFEKVKTYFKPFREKRSELEKERRYVEDVLAKGAEKARYYAAKTLQKVRRKTGLTYKK